MTDMQNFSQAKKLAAEEILNISKRAASTSSKYAQNPLNNMQNNIFNSINLHSDDNLLIIGLIIILYKDSHDILLFLALIYILLG